MCILSNVIISNDIIISILVVIVVPFSYRSTLNAKNGPTLTFRFDLNLPYPLLWQQFLLPTTSFLSNFNANDANDESSEHSPIGIL